MCWMGPPCCAQTQTAAPITRIENAIWNLDGSALALQLAQEPSPLQRAFYRHNFGFIQTLAGQSPALYERFYVLSDSVADVLSAQPEDAFVLAYRMELYFERAIAKLLQQRNFSAVWDLREAYKLSQRLAQKYPKQHLHGKVLGIFQVAISSLPDNYRWLANLLGYRAELTAGLKNIADACKQTPLLQQEAFAAQYFVLKLGLNDPEQAGAWLDSLHRNNTPSRVLNYLHAISLVDRKRNAEAIPALKSIASDAELQAGASFPYPVYALARSYLYAGQHAEAIQAFRRFLTLCRGSILVRDAAARMAHCHYLVGDVPQARQALKLVGELPDSGFDEDVFATRYAKQHLTLVPTASELQLLRARYAFDGGYYTQALALLQQMSAANIDPASETEYAYRTARIYQQIGRPDSARTWYLQCIRTSPQGKLWMKVHARYYLGQLAEQQQDVAAARLWYRQVLDFPSYDYRLGMEQKTRSALQRLDNQTAPAAKP